MKAAWNCGRVPDKQKKRGGSSRPSDRPPIGSVWKLCSIPARSCAALIPFYISARSESRSSELPPPHFLPLCLACHSVAREHRCVPCEEHEALPKPLRSPTPRHRHSVRLFTTGSARERRGDESARLWIFPPRSPRHLVAPGSPATTCWPASAPPRLSIRRAVRESVPGRHSRYASSPWGRKLSPEF